MVLSQKDPRWGNLLLGQSIYYIWAKGCTITVIAECLGVTPAIVNERLNALTPDGAGNTGFALDGNGQRAWVIWAKIAQAFSGVQVMKFYTYNNDEILKALSEGKKVIVEVPSDPIGLAGGRHWVRYIGDGKLHDPWTGTERPTSDFPNPVSYVVISGEWTEHAAHAGTVDEYSGLDLANMESNKLAAHVWKDVIDGKYVKTELLHGFLHQLCDALGIESTIETSVILEKAAKIKEVMVATPEAPTNLQSIPHEEKQKLLQKVEEMKQELLLLLGF